MSKFDSFQRDMESHVVARMVLSREYGYFAKGGLLGLGSISDPFVNYETHPFEEQYEAFTSNTPFSFYWLYKTHIGGQGLFFSWLDQNLNIDGQSKLELFATVTVILNVIVFTLIIYWFVLEFGSSVGFLVFCSVFISQWLTLFGRNLYWSLWSFYLGFLVLLMYFRKKQSISSYALMGMLTCLMTLFKLIFTGYEFVTTYLLMLWIPYAYYVIKNKTVMRETVKGAITIGLAQLVAIVVSIGVLSIQLAQLENGDFGAGVRHIIYSFEKRTYGNIETLPDEYTQSLQADLLTVLSVYFSFPFFNPYYNLPIAEAVQYTFSISYQYLVLFVLITLLLTFKSWRKTNSHIRILVMMSLLSLLPPLSWFVLFKSHSYVHFHMNFIVWQMPFTLFVFALIGEVLKVRMRK